MNIQKANWQNSSDKIHLALPFAKVDKEKRTVSGFATLDNVDKHGDIVTADASEIAFDKFRGNLREMHQPIAVGKVLSFNTQDFIDPKSNKNYKGIFVEAYISKGAQDTWEKVLDGTLTGFSIGGNIVKASMEPDDNDMNEKRRVVKEYELMELSLVDNPANPLANIFSIQKIGDSSVMKGMATEVEIENIFWCKTDQIASSDSREEAGCIVCGDQMDNIGWVEKNDVEKSAVIQKAVSLYITKDDAPISAHGPNNIAMESPSSPISSDDTVNMYPDQNPIGVTKGGVKVGSFVKWNSSGGTAYGKVLRIVKNGSIKVPNSSFTIKAEKDNPAVLVRVYKKTEKGFVPTDTTVGHKANTLKIANMRVKTMSKEILSKGGTEMAFDPEDTVESASVDEVVELVEEVEETVEATAVATDIEEIATEEVDFTKMATDLKTYLGGALQKSADALKEANINIEGKIEKSFSELQVNIDNLSTDYSALLEKNSSLESEISELKKSLGTVAERLAQYESDTAIKKSGEVEQASETKIQKSIWQGHFLGVSDL